MKKLFANKIFRWALAAVLVCGLVLLLTLGNTYEGKYPFKGSGVVSDPYRISTVRELRILRDLVNEGESFAGCYFRQTRDLNLSVIEGWEPIGAKDAEGWFCGVYNGAGHVIKNLNVDGAEFAGLFGQLGGTVMNLGIDSGSISGDFSGSIASHSAGTSAIILNCYNRAEVSGVYRAGGIADNFSDGAIIGCWNDGTLRAPAYAGICSLDASVLIFNISTKWQVLDSFSGSYDFNQVLSASDTLAEDNLSVFHANTTQTLTPVQQLRRTYLTGCGSITDPYRIKTEEDLSVFRHLVNAGCDFSGSYVRQEADLDLSAVDNWIPIGRWGGKKYFAGTYDGAGHTISNLSIARQEGVGLFGTLCGTVMNLGIESGSVSGTCAGGIAANGLNGRILNCFNQADISGSQAAGIAATFEKGQIIDCWSSGALTGDLTAGICTGNTGYVVYCTGIGSSYIPEGSVGIYDEGNKRSDQTDTVIAQNLQAFQDRVSEYATAEQQLLSSLVGTGSRNDPYRICSVSDLCRFRTLVNLGVDFDGSYVRQEADLDLKDIPNWVPIGFYPGSHPFRGVYDGAGHTISNLNAHSQPNPGFFGSLHGAVMNLGIESGKIYGTYAGAIASTGSNAVIINCYNKASVIGDLYAGGIASIPENAFIVNCLNAGTVSSEGVFGGIAAHSVQKVVNSYSVDCEILPEGSDILTDSLSGTVSDTEQATKLLNDHQYAATAAVGRLYLNLAGWNTDGSFGTLHNYMLLFALQHTLTALLVLVSAILILTVIKLTKKNASLSPSSFRLVWDEKRMVLRQSMDQQLRFLFCGTFALALSLLAGSFLIGDNTVTKSFFLHYTNDEYMDFFNPMHSIYNSNYELNGHYTELGGSYPPIARAILWLSGRVLPYNIWGLTSGDVRTNVYGAMMFLLVAIGFFLAMYALFSRLDGSGSKALVLMCLFSSPMLFLVERGNVLIFSLLLSALFVAGYRSEKPLIRHLSYLCLGLAAGIKIYPAALGLLVLREKNWKHTLQCVAYGVILCIGPFSLIGGIPELLLYIRNITHSIEGNMASISGEYMNYANTLAVIGQLFGNTAAGQTVAKYTLYPFILVLAGCGLLSKDRWKTVLAATLIVLLLPGYTIYYCAAMMVIPLLCFVSAQHDRKIDYVYAALLLLTLVPLQFLCGAYGVTAEQIRGTAAFAILILALVLIGDVAVATAKQLACRRR